MIQLFVNELIGSIVQLLVFTILPFLWWFVTARKETGLLSWLGLKRIIHTERFQRTLMITAVVSVTYAVLAGLCVEVTVGEVTTAGSQFAGKGFIALPAALVYAFVRTGLAEEIVFRGFLLKRIAGRFGFVTGNLIQSLLFGLLHGLPFGIITHSVLVTLLLTILPGTFGYYQGWLNEKRCGGSIIPSWLLHGIMNFLVACSGL